VRAVEVGADLDARGLARLLGRRQAVARAMQRRLDGGHGGPERRGDLGIPQPVHLHQESRALLVRELCDVGHQPTHLLALLGLDDRIAIRRAGHLVQLARQGHRPADLIDAVVVRDPVEPGAEHDRAVVATQRARRAHEHLLQRVLGVGVRPAQHLPGVREEDRAVPVVDRDEGFLVALPEQGDELVVGAESQQTTVGSAPAGRRPIDHRSFHGLPSAVCSEAGHLRLHVLLKAFRGAYAPGFRQISRAAARRL